MTKSIDSVKVRASTLVLFFILFASLFLLYDNLLWDTRIFAMLLGVLPISDTLFNEAINTAG